MLRSPSKGETRFMRDVLALRGRVPYDARVIAPRTATLATPIGTLVVSAMERGICALGFADGVAADDDVPVHARRCVTELGEYFAGERRSFSALPLVLEGSDFSLDVWEALSGIPYGETLAYGALAERIGRSGAARAVGGAVGRNPLAILIPCHRVTGAQEFGGYAWGEERKLWLLRHERRAEAGNDKNY